MKKIMTAIGIVCLALVFSGCGTSTPLSVTTGDVTFKTEDLAEDLSSWDGVLTFSTAEGITSVSYSGEEGTESLTVEGTLVTVTGAGTYLLEGVGSGVQIAVNASKNATVTLILGGVDLTSTDGPVIYGLSSDKIILNLREGTDNVLSDSASSTSDIHSCVFSNDDLSVNGTGTLTVHGNVENGINSHDDIRIASGTLVIEAENDCLKANDSIAVREASLTLTAGNDAFHAENGDDASQGVVQIESGTLAVSAYGDGLSASGTVTVLGGNLTLLTGVSNSNVDSVSGKGLKAPLVQIGGGTLALTCKDDGIHGDTVLVAGGTLTISTSDDGIYGESLLEITGGDSISITSKDDAVHSADSFLMTGGNLAISAGDDGIHAESTLRIEGGTVGITKSYEGIEGLDIVISGGSISLVSSDDGFNAAGGTDTSGSSVWGGGGMMEQSNATLSISGGYIYVNAKGDGLDCNGAMTMSGGTVVVSGPTDSANGPLDYGTFKMTGGFLVAAGSSGMAQNVGSSSTQYGVLVYFSSSSTSLIRIQDEDGNEILTFLPAKSYQCVVISSPDLKKNVTYSVYQGGTVGTYDSLLNGLYTGATYTQGTLFKTFTVTSAATSVGSGGTMR